MNHGSCLLYTSAQYVTIESGQTSSVHFSNILKKFRVHVVKSDADTGNAQGDATLAGATYGIFRDGELIDTYTCLLYTSYFCRFGCGTEIQLWLKTAGLPAGTGAYVLACSWYEPD